MASKKKKSSAKKPTKKAAKKATKKAAKKATKKAAKKATKKPAKKATQKPAKKATQKPAKKATQKPAKKATKKAPAYPVALPPKKKPLDFGSLAKAYKDDSSAAIPVGDDAHVVALPKKKSLDLSSLAKAYKDDATAHAVTAEVMDGVRSEGLRGDGEILHVDGDDSVAPCRLVDHGEGRFSLCFDDFQMPEVPLFAERGLEGGGYTWEAIADSLLRLRRPDLVDQVSWDSEAGMFVAVGNRPNLVVVARLLQEAMASPAVMKQAIDAADPDRLE